MYELQQDRIHNSTVCGNNFLQPSHILSDVVDSKHVGFTV